MEFERYNHNKWFNSTDFGDLNQLKELLFVPTNQISSVR